MFCQGILEEKNRLWFIIRLKVGGGDGIDHWRANAYDAP